MNYNITSCFDWFQCVFDHIPYYEKFGFEQGQPKNYIELDKILNILRVPEKFITLMGSCSFGSYGFKYRVQIYEGINLLLFGPKNGEEKNTTLLQISGKGCSYLTEFNIWNDLFKYCLDNNAKFTRLDEATDIKGDYPLTIYKIYNCFRKGNYKSIFKKDYTIIGKHPENELEGKTNNLTIYGGSKGNSSSFVRIYNKAVEQNLDPIAEPWLRIEMQIQDSSKINCVINAFMIAYDNKNINLFNSVVLGTLQDFLMLTNDDGSIYQDWENFLQDFESIKLFSNPKSKNTYDTSLEWFKRCVSRFLAMTILVHGEKYLYDLIIEEGYKNMMEFDRNSLNVVNSKMYSMGFGKDKYSLDEIHKLAKSELFYRDLLDDEK